MLCRVPECFEVKKFLEASRDLNFKFIRETLFSERKILFIINT